ncbi:MAG: hypothetical protein ABIO91_07215 [Pyrinomonadaceae bacterium]
MTHFLYLVGFGLFVSVVFAAIHVGSPKARILYGSKTFLQFVGISLLIAWILYFIP